MFYYALFQTIMVKNSLLGDYKKDLKVNDQKRYALCIGFHLVERFLAGNLNMSGSSCLERRGDYRALL
jgi:hypothetical protein